MVLDEIMQHRAKCIISLFLLGLFSVPMSEAKNGIYPSDLNSRPIDEYSTALCKRIYSNWEVPDERSMRFRVHMFIDENGRFSNITIKSDLANEQDLFSCYEAVSSVSGFRKTVPAGIFEVELLLNSDEATVADYFAKFVRDVGSPGGQIVWHRIPLETLQCNAMLKRSLVRSEGNLRFGSKSEFEEIKKSWIEFLRSSTCPTERQIWQHANSIDKRFFH